MILKKIHGRLLNPILMKIQSNPTDGVPSSEVPSSEVPNNGGTVIDEVD